MAYYFRDPFFADPFVSPFNTFHDNSLENRIVNTLERILENPYYSVSPESHEDDQHENKKIKVNENENEKNETKVNSNSKSNSKLNMSKSSKDTSTSIPRNSNVTSSLYNWIKNYKIFHPRIDIVETEKNYQIHADLPGIKKEDVKLDVSDDGILSISGERMYKNQSDNKDGSYYTKIERNSGKFKRAFTLPKNADKTNIYAKMENGVLIITINKKELPKKATKSIQIQ